MFGPIPTVRAEVFPPFRIREKGRRQQPIQDWIKQWFAIRFYLTLLVKYGFTKRDKSGTIFSIMNTSRAEHIQWCKDRAMEYVYLGDFNQALASLFSDLGKHPETAGHLGIGLGAALMNGGHLSNEFTVTEFIQGFN